MSQRRPLIIHYTTSQLLGLIAGVILLLAAVASAGFFYGDKTYSDDQQYIEGLETSFDQTLGDFSASQQALAAIQLTAQVDASALEQTRQQMLDMQKQLYRREQELKLYREMLQDNNKSTGLSVGNFHIVRAGERLFQYDWVVQQKTHEAKNLRVNAKIWVVGIQDGEGKNLSLNEIDAEVDDLPIQLKLKYFSINRGFIKLPEGFNPEFVRVTLRYPWIEKPQFDKKFVWQIQE
ncbi:MAG: hypothetical protein P8J25_06010 [Porticoccaceae bacterium]|nr:hypothetical protein [Porticoccaceae bacterium]